MNARETGAVIAELRKKAGYTQKALSEALGVTDKAVSKWERGLGCPDISLLPKLSILLDTDIESLISGKTVYHENAWKGIIFLADEEDTYAGTLIYDKPLVYYLISNFLLVGVREILFFVNIKNHDFIEKTFGSGGRIGIKIHYSICDNENNFNLAFRQSRAFTEGHHLMILYGKMLLYGLNITRQFQVAMTCNMSATQLGLDKKTVPLLFLDKQICDEIFSDDLHSMNDLLKKLSAKQLVKTRQMGRGMISLPLNTFHDAVEASSFVRLIQKTQGQYIAGIEEIAWRRGLISKKQLCKLKEELSDEEYKAYLSEIC